MPGAPKDSHAIRKALEAIRAGADIATPVGPHAEGMSPDHPVLIAAFVDRDVARTFQKILIEHGIEPNSENVGGRCKVLVDAKDVRQATEIYLDRKKSLKDGKSSRNPNRYDLLILSTVISLTLGLIFLLVLRSMKFDAKNEVEFWLLATKASLLFFAIFVVAGHLGDRFRMKRHKDPKLSRSVDVWEFLLLFTFPVMIFVLFGTVANLLQLL